MRSTVRLDRIDYASSHFTSFKDDCLSSVSGYFTLEDSFMKSETDLLKTVLEWIRFYVFTRIEIPVWVPGSGTNEVQTEVWCLV